MADSSSPNYELHFATLSCLDEDGNKVRVSRTKYSMGTNSSSEEIVAWVIRTKHFLQGKKKRTESGEKGWEEKYGLVIYSKIITTRGGVFPHLLGKTSVEELLSTHIFTTILPLFPSLLPLLIRKTEKNLFLLLNT